MNSNEIELLITLKHPDPYTDWDGFVDSLPDEAFVPVFLLRWNGEYPGKTKRETMKYYYNENKYYLREHLWKDEVEAFRVSLYEYYENQP